MTVLMRPSADSDVHHTSAEPALYPDVMSGPAANIFDHAVRWTLFMGQMAIHFLTGQGREDSASTTCL
jgi:hypothetical protein